MVFEPLTACPASPALPRLPFLACPASCRRGTGTGSMCRWYCS